MYISGPAAGTAPGIFHQSHISNTKWIKFHFTNSPFSVRFPWQKLAMWR